MKPFAVWTTVFVVYAVSAAGQQNFRFNPEHPQPGDSIFFTYEGAGDLAATAVPVEAVVYRYGTKDRRVDDVSLTRKGNVYSGAIATDGTMSLLNVVFYADKRFDNNYDDGYLISLYENDRARKGSFAWRSHFYEFAAPTAGVSRDNKKALAMIEKEMAAYPADRSLHVERYARLQLALKNPDASQLIQKEIETKLKEGLNQEQDYALVETLYGMLKLKEQARLIAGLKREKFPNGKWRVNATLQSFYAEKDIAKQTAILDEITRKANSDSNWSSLKPNLSYYKRQLIYGYVSRQDWKGFQQSMADAGDISKDEMALLFNAAAWTMQESGKELSLAETFTTIATLHAKREWQFPSGQKPDGLTQRQWKQQRENTYAMYADTYGMVKYLLGKFKDGVVFARDAAMVIGKGQNTDLNNTYALLAEKALPQKTWKKELEQFVKEGKSTEVVREILLRGYRHTHRTDEGFSEYYTGLEQARDVLLVTRLKETMLRQPAPAFALLDLSGKKITSDEFRGKVVVLDFWATWCGPCKASFPGMQQLLNKYEAADSVRFLFVDTWEREADKEKNVADFLAEHKYSFQVLMDNENKVVEQFNVDGIPTRFVIDKNGVIRFRSVGFEGSEEKMMAELTAMIKLAGEPLPKGF